MISRTAALELVQERVPNENLLKHMLAVEAVIRALAKRLGEDEELWGVTGLLHDLDYDKTFDNPDRHAYLTCDELKDDLPPEALHAILAHPGHVQAESKFDWALYCADPVTGLVIAAVLMHPARKLEVYKVKSLKKRFKDKRFAAGADRDQIRACEKLGLELDEFLSLALEAMTEIADQLGL